MRDPTELGMKHLSLASSDQLALPNPSPEEVGVLPPNQPRLTSECKDSLIERLPEEIVVAIFDLLSVPDLVRCRQVRLIRPGVKLVTHTFVIPPSYQ